MKKNKIIIYLLITIVSLLSLSSEVLAIVGYGEGQGGTDGGSWSNPRIGINNYEQGIRISVYNYDKNQKKITKLGHSIDIMRTKSDYTWFVSATHYYRANSNSNLMSKFDYILNYKNYYQGYYPMDDKISTISKNLDSIFDDNQDSKKNLYYLDNGELYDVNNSKKQGLGFSYDVLWGPSANSNSNSRFKNTFLNYLKRNNNTNYKKLFELMGVNEYSCSDTYIIVEALGSFYEKIYNSSGGDTGKRHRYVGTAYELSTYQHITSLSDKIPKVALSLFVSGTQNSSQQSEFIRDYLDTVSGSVDKVSVKNARGQNGYGVNIFWLKDVGTCQTSECQYTPQYFADNNNDGKPDYTYTDASGTTRDCCYYFSNGSNKKNNLVEDYPICGTCPDTTRITITDTNNSDNSVSGVPQNKAGTYDFSDRCSITGKNKKITQGKTSNYVIEDYLSAGIEDNQCLPITNTTMTDKSGYNLINKNINSYCTIKCVEDDHFSIPSDPKITISTDHFVWPTSPSTARMFSNNYPMTATGNVTCRIIVKAESLKKDSNVSDFLNKCASLGNVDINEINQFDPEVKLNQVDTNNNSHDLGTLTKYNEVTSCKKGTSGNINTNVACSSLKNSITFSTTDNVDTKISKIRNFRFSITKTMGLQLNPTINSYINKKTSEYKSKRENNQQYTVIGYGNIPIYVNTVTLGTNINETTSSTINGTLTLNINKVSEHFKNNSSISCDASYSAFSENDTDYPSSQTFYYCRPGTNSEGKDISNCDKNGDGILDKSCIVEECSDRKYYCSAWTDKPGKVIPATSAVKVNNTIIAPNGFEGKVNDYKNNGNEDTETAIRSAHTFFDNSSYCSGNNDCPSGECPIECEKPSGEKVDITECISEHGKEYCVKEKCGVEKYFCEAPYNERDITNCVKKYMKAGLDLGPSKQKCYIENNCYSTNCPPGTPGCPDTPPGGNPKKLIYRPIDLNNPFPSITGIIDNSMLGRLPGSNWITNVSSNLKNSQTIVNTYITNNRGVTTTDVYKKTPLYTFELNASTIAKIKEYNKTHSYDDFELNCSSNGTECISKDFVHNTRYGFIDNTSRSSCAGITFSNFYKCSE